MNEELAIVIRAKDEASGVLNGLINRFGELANAARLLEGSLLAIGAALAAGAKFAGDYKASLDRIAAALDATSEDMKKIDASIREIASGSQFSFDAIAKAIERLVQTGYSAKEAMGGLVQAAKDLAIISRENIADVAERLGQLVRIFGEEGKNASTIADQMAKAMVSIGASATELASALIKLSPIVTSGGDSLERLLALLELLNQRGVSVTEAVSGLQRAFAQFELLKVGEVSQKMANALERLGPAAQQAAKAVQAGRMSFIEFIDVIADLDPSFGTLVELFGQFGARVVDKVIPALKDVVIAFGPFSVTLKDTQRDFDRLVEQFANVEGAAAKIAATVQNNLPGAFREFGASLKNFLIDLVGGTAAIEKALKAVSSFLDKIGQFFREHGGLFGVIKEAFITLGTAVYDFFKEVGEKIVEFFKGIPKRIVDAFQSVWNALLEGLAAFFEKVPVIGQSIAEWLRGKKFEIELATEVTAQITLSTVQATAEIVDLSGDNVQAKVSEVVVRDVQNLTLPGFTSTAIQELLSMPRESFVILSNEAGSLASGFAMVNHALTAAGAIATVLRIEEEKRRIEEEKLREAQARQQALQQDINRGLDYLARVLGRVLGPLQPLVDLLRGTIGPFTALLQILGNLIAQSRGFTRLLKAINKLLQPLADAIGAIFDAIAERILGPETETSGKKKEQERGQNESYQAGGYTRGPRHRIAGVVHGGEWVAPAWMVRKFPEVFFALERIRRGYQVGGYVGTGVVIIGQTNDLVSAIEEAADHVANTIVRTGNAIKKAVASLNIPTGYKLERAAWGVARPGEPWGWPEEEAIPQPVIGPEPSPEPGPEPSPEPPSEAPAPWREWVERLLDWIKPGIDAVVRAFKWLDSFLASLGIEQPLRGLIQLALAIVAMEAAWKTLTGLVSWASSAISDFILGLLKGAGAALWEAIKAAGMAIWPAIQGAGQAIWGGIQAVAKGIWPAIQSAGQAIWGGVQAAAQGIWPAIQSDGQAIWGGVQTVAQGIWPAIQSTGQAIWSGIQAVAQGIWPAIQGAGQAIWSGIQAVAQGIWPAIQGAGQAIWSGIQAVAQGIWPAIQGAGQAIWSGIQAVAQGIWPAIQGAGQAIWGGVQAVAKGIWPAIQSAGQAIWGMIANAGIGIWPLIIAAAIGAFALLGPQILEFFRNLFYGIAQLFVQVVDFVFQPIKWIMNGLIWVINSIIGVVNWALGWLGVRIPQIPYLQEGGYILREGLAYLHRGELVVPARAVPAGGVGPTIYIGEVHLHGVEDPEEFMARLEDYIRRRNLRGTGQRYGTYAIAGA